jgi:hypothetical protein
MPKTLAEAARMNLSVPEHKMRETYVDDIEEVGDVEDEDILDVNVNESDAELLEEEVDVEGRVIDPITRFNRWFADLETNKEDLDRVFDFFPFFDQYISAMYPNLLEKTKKQIEKELEKLYEAMTNALSSTRGNKGTFMGKAIRLCVNQVKTIVATDTNVHGFDSDLEARFNRLSSLEVTLPSVHNVQLDIAVLKSILGDSLSKQVILEEYLQSERISASQFHKLLGEDDDTVAELDSYDSVVELLKLKMIRMQQFMTMYNDGLIVTNITPEDYARVLDKCHSIKSLEDVAHSEKQIEAYSENNVNDLKQIYSRIINADESATTDEIFRVFETGSIVAIIKKYGAFIHTEPYTVKKKNVEVHMPSDIASFTLPKSFDTKNLVKSSRKAKPITEPNKIAKTIAVSATTVDPEKVALQRYIEQLYKNSESIYRFGMTPNVTGRVELPDNDLLLKFVKDSPGYKFEPGQQFFYKTYGCEVVSVKSNVVTFMIKQSGEKHYKKVVRHFNEPGDEISAVEEPKKAKNIKEAKAMVTQSLNDLFNEPGTKYQTAIRKISVKRQMSISSKGPTNPKVGSLKPMHAKPNEYFAENELAVGSLVSMPAEELWSVISRDRKSVRSIFNFKYIGSPHLYYKKVTALTNWAYANGVLHYNDNHRQMFAETINAIVRKYNQDPDAMSFDAKLALVKSKETIPVDLDFVNREAVVTPLDNEGVVTTNIVDAASVDMTYTYNKLAQKPETYGQEFVVPRDMLLNQLYSSIVVYTSIGDAIQVGLAKMADGLREFHFVLHNTKGHQFMRLVRKSDLPSDFAAEKKKESAESVHFSEKTRKRAAAAGKYANYVVYEKSSNGYKKAPAGYDSKSKTQEVVFVYPADTVNGSEYGSTRRGWWCTEYSVTEDSKLMKSSVLYTDFNDFLVAYRTSLYASALLDNDLANVNYQKMQKISAYLGDHVADKMIKRLKKLVPVRAETVLAPTCEHREKLRQILSKYQVPNDVVDSAVEKIFDSVLASNSGGPINISNIEDISAITKMIEYMYVLDHSSDLVYKLVNGTLSVKDLLDNSEEVSKITEVVQDFQPDIAPVYKYIDNYNKNISDYKKKVEKSRIVKKYKVPFKHHVLSIDNFGLLKQIITAEMLDDDTKKMTNAHLLTCLNNYNVFRKYVLSAREAGRKLTNKEQVFVAGLLKNVPTFEMSARTIRSLTLRLASQSAQQNRVNMFYVYAIEKFILDISRNASEYDENVRLVLDMFSFDDQRYRGKLVYKSKSVETSLKKYYDKLLGDVKAIVFGEEKSSKKKKTDKTKELNKLLKSLFDCIVAFDFATNYAINFASDDAFAEASAALFKKLGSGTDKELALIINEVLQDITKTVLVHYEGSTKIEKVYEPLVILPKGAYKDYVIEYKNDIITMPELDFEKVKQGLWIKTIENGSAFMTSTYKPVDMDMRGWFYLRLSVFDLLNVLYYAYRIGRPSHPYYKQPFGYYIRIYNQLVGNVDDYVPETVDALNVDFFIKFKNMFVLSSNEYYILKMEQETIIAKLRHKPAMENTKKIRVHTDHSIMYPVPYYDPTRPMQPLIFTEKQEKMLHEHLRDGSMSTWLTSRVSELNPNQLPWRIVRKKTLIKSTHMVAGHPRTEEVIVDPDAALSMSKNYIEITLKDPVYFNRAYKMKVGVLLNKMPPVYDFIVTTHTSPYEESKSNLEVAKDSQFDHDDNVWALVNNKMMNKELVGNIKTNVWTWMPSDSNKIHEWLMTVQKAKEFIVDTSRKNPAIINAIKQQATRNLEVSRYNLIREELHKQRTQKERQGLSKDIWKWKPVYAKDTVYWSKIVADYQRMLEELKTKYKALNYEDLPANIKSQISRQVYATMSEEKRQNLFHTVYEVEHFKVITRLNHIKNTSLPSMYQDISENEATGKVSSKIDLVKLRALVQAGFIRVSADAVKFMKYTDKIDMKPFCQHPLDKDTIKQKKLPKTAKGYYCGRDCVRGTYFCKEHKKMIEEHDAEYFVEDPKQVLAFEFLAKTIEPYYRVYKHVESVYVNERLQDEVSYQQVSTVLPEVLIDYLCKKDRTVYERIMKMIKYYDTVYSKTIVKTQTQGRLNTARYYYPMIESKEHVYNISMKDVLQYLGSSYQENVVYYNGTIKKQVPCVPGDACFNADASKNGTKYAIGGYATIATGDTKSKERQLRKGEYYINPDTSVFIGSDHSIQIATNILSDTEVSSTAARRQALFYHLDLNDVPPAYSNFVNGQQKNIDPSRRNLINKKDLKAWTESLSIRAPQFDIPAPDVEDWKPSEWSDDGWSVYKLDEKRKISRADDDAFRVVFRPVDYVLKLDPKFFD